MVNSSLSEEEGQREREGKSELEREVERSQKYTICGGLVGCSINVASRNRERRDKKGRGRGRERGRMKDLHGYAHGRWR